MDQSMLDPNLTCYSKYEGKEWYKGMDTKSWKELELLSDQFIH